VEALVKVLPNANIVTNEYDITNVMDDYIPRDIPLLV
jgi:hypothetical protein